MSAAMNIGKRDKDRAREFIIYLYETNTMDNNYSIRRREVFDIFLSYYKLTKRGGKYAFYKFVITSYGIRILKSSGELGVLQFDGAKLASLIDNNRGIPGACRKLGINVTVCDFASLNKIIVRKNERRTIQLEIVNTTTTISYAIVYIKCNESNCVAFVPKLGDLPPRVPFNLYVDVCPKRNGVIHLPILLGIRVNSKNKKNKKKNNADLSLVPIDLVLHVHGKAFDSLHATGPYKKRLSQPVLNDHHEDVVDGERPEPIPTDLIYKTKLKSYNLDGTLLAILNSGIDTFEPEKPQQKEKLAEIRSTLLDASSDKNHLNSQNYTKLLDLLLFMEEYQMRINIRDYDVADQNLLKHNNNKFELNVPGLAEQRPSVIYGDTILVQEGAGAKKFKGYVHEVRESSVLLGFAQSFRDEVYVKGKKFSVSFNFNRLPMRVEHQAVELVQKCKIAALFFPTIADLKVEPSPKHDLKWFNRDIERNPEQQQAVINILNRSVKPSVPYLIFGPPGTGKTVTICEAIKQLHRLTTVNVLVCAPSNNAANEVARRLVDTIAPKDLFRFVSASASYRDIPQALHKYINYKNGQYYYPALETFKTFRIVVTTLISASRLVNAGIGADHFRYVFIDESGHSTEAETLVPIAGVISSPIDRPGTIRGQIVLAGDPQQLGPIIHSKLAKQYGFESSMLERLMKTLELYQKDGSTKKYNSDVLTKLLKNYRSHPVLIKQSNEMFYDGEIQPNAPEDFINLAVGWAELPNPEFPFVFHSVAGIDQTDKDSPSWYNIHEIAIVKYYLDKLIGTKLKGYTVKGKDIAVITPYRKQVKKIKAACRDGNYDQLTICSTEQIQGQERLITIISTVRCNPKHRMKDQKFHLGFLNNPKRLNVAITRGKALLIVIGNGCALQADENWRKLILYCKENNSCVGDEFEISPESDSLSDHLKLLSVQDEEFEE